DSRTSRSDRCGALPSRADECGKAYPRLALRGNGQIREIGKSHFRLQTDTVQNGPFVRRSIPMHRPAPNYGTLDDWVARESIAFDVHSPDSRNSAVDRMIAALGESVDLLGFGEAMHGWPEILVLRN